MKSLALASFTDYKNGARLHPSATSHVNGPNGLAYTGRSSYLHDDKRGKGIFEVVGSAASGFDKLVLALGPENFAGNSAMTLYAVVSGGTKLQKVADLKCQNNQTEKKFYKDVAEYEGRCAAIAGKVFTNP